MTDISLLVSFFGLLGALISIMPLDFTPIAPLAGQGSPAGQWLPAATPKFKEDEKYIIMGIDFGVIWAADFDYDIRFYVRRPASRPRITRRPPTHQKSRKMTNISLWYRFWGYLAR